MGEQTVGSEQTDVFLKQLERYPGLQELYDLPLNNLLQRTAKCLTDAQMGFEGLAGDLTGEWSLFSGTAILAENDHTVERIRMQCTKHSISAVYETEYKGKIGKIIRPTAQWAVAHDNDSYFYWNEASHGGTATLFALAGTDCEEITPNDAEAELMRQCLSSVLYRIYNPTVAPEIRKSDIEAPNLKQRLGLYEFDM